MPKIILTIFLLILAASSASNVQAQACGQSFARFIVSDSTGKSVSNATIELLTAPSKEEFEKLWEQYGNKEPGFQPNPFKIPSSVAEEIIKQNLPLSRTEDFCGNPLKQTERKTKVKTLDDARNNREGSKKNFGFCTTENSDGKLLLKISAPGYITDYYIGGYLGGCSQGWGFVLTKGKNPKKTHQSMAMPNKLLDVRREQRLSYHGSF